jgi:hypothetical protein
MNNVQKWELAGVPAAVVFEALYRMEAFTALGITSEQLPHIMILAFVTMALVRSAIDYAKKPTE